MNPRFASEVFALAKVKLRSRAVKPRFASEVFALAKVKLRSRAVKFVPKAQVKFWLCQSEYEGITYLSTLQSRISSRSDFIRACEDFIRRADFIPSRARGAYRAHTVCISRGIPPPADMLHITAPQVPPPSNLTRLL